MGFGRRYGKRNYGNNGYNKKRKLKTQIRLVGILVLIIGFLTAISASQSNNQNIGILSVVLIIIGMVLIMQKEGYVILAKT